jgi:hypothetical protein
LQRLSVGTATSSTLVDPKGGIVNTDAGIALDISGEGSLLTVGSTGAVTYVPVGTQGQVLTVNSTSSTDFDWQNLPAGGSTFYVAPGDDSISTHVSGTSTYVSVQELPLGTLIDSYVGYLAGVVGTSTGGIGVWIDNYSIVPNAEGVLAAFINLTANDGSLVQTPSFEAGEVVLNVNRVGAIYAGLGFGTFNPAASEFVSPGGLYIVPITGPVYPLAVSLSTNTISTLSTGTNNGFGAAFDIGGRPVTAFLYSSTSTTWGLIVSQNYSGSNNSTLTNSTITSTQLNSTLPVSLTFLCSTKSLSTYIQGTYIGSTAFRSTIENPPQPPGFLIVGSSTHIAALSGVGIYTPQGYPYFQDNFSYPKGDTLSTVNPNVYGYIYQTNTYAGGNNFYQLWSNTATVDYGEVSTQGLYSNSTGTLWAMGYQPTINGGIGVALNPTGGLQLTPSGIAIGPTALPITVSGSISTGTATANLLSTLAAMGLIINSTTS